MKKFHWVDRYWWVHSVNLNSESSKWIAIDKEFRWISEDTHIHIYGILTHVKITAKIEPKHSSCVSANVSHVNTSTSFHWYSSHLLRHLRNGTYIIQLHPPQTSIATAWCSNVFIPINWMQITVMSTGLFAAAAWAPYLELYIYLCM